MSMAAATLTELIGHRCSNEGGAVIRLRLSILTSRFYQALPSNLTATEAPLFLVQPFKIKSRIAAQLVTYLMTISTGQG
jgi:hypothetical protein